MRIKLENMNMWRQINKGNLETDLTIFWVLRNAKCLRMQIAIFSNTGKKPANRLLGPQAIKYNRATHKLKE